MTPSDKEVNKIQLSMYNVRIKLMVVLDKFPGGGICVGVIFPYKTYEREA